MFTSYNAKDCTVVVDTTYITGLSETMVTGEKDEEHFSTSVGAQGDVVMSEINNPLGTITITLQATSPQKALLTSFANSGAIFPMWVTNRSIGERFGGSKCRIKKTPSYEHAQEAGDREFEIQCFDYTVQSL